MAVEEPKREIDAETQKILSEMEADKKAETTEESKPEAEKPKVEAAPEEDKTKAEETPAPTDEPKPEAEDVDGEAKPEPTEKVERVSKYMPINKYQKQKEKWEQERAAWERERAELVAKAEASSNKPTATDDEIRAIADKHGVEPSVIDDLITAVSKKVSIPEEKLKKIDHLEKLVKDQFEEKAQEAGYEREYSALIAKNPDANNPEIKSRLKELAFTDEYARTPLPLIYAYYYPKAEKKVTKTAESSRNVTPKKTVSLDTMSSEDLENLSDEEFVKLSEELARSSKSKIVRH